MNEIRLWDWIVFDGSRCQVVGLNAGTVEIQNASSLRCEVVPQSELVSRSTVQERRSALREVAELERLPASELERCERIAGILSGADSNGQAVQVAIDHAREMLARNGITVSARQVRRYLDAYRAHGVAGLVDRRRTGKSRSPQVDARINQLAETELSNQRDISTGTRSRAINRVRGQADRLDIAVPSRATMYRVVADLDRGRSTFGPATTRRSKALRPDRTFRGTTATRPGELVEIDSTPLDVIALAPDGSRCRPELTYAIDVATKTICGTLLRAGATKSVDIGALLIARMLTPLAKRPGWPATRDHARMLLGPDFIPSDEEWDDLASTMPLIVPESVTIDRGKVFTGSTFTAACERLEISQIRANPRRPTDKPHVEGGFKRIRDGFVQYLAGFTGGSVADRGVHPETDAVWTVEELQILLDLWVLTSWQSTPQSGLRLPDTPRRTLSPNQMYQALSVAAPQVEVGLTEDDYIALMPVAWRTIQAYGVNLNALTYDDVALHPLRGRSSGVSGQAKGRWEVRYDPYNLRQVWLHDPRSDQWITVNWTLAALSEQPFSREILRAARAAVDADAPRASRGIELLDQITRLQNERAVLRKKRRAAGVRVPPPTQNEPLLHIVDGTTRASREASQSELEASPQRLKILE